MFIHAPMRKLFYGSILIGAAAIGVATMFWPQAIFFLGVLIPFIIVGFSDIFQNKHAIKRNFPIIGHGRYIMESVRPEINQYFVESNLDGRPFNRLMRSNVYQRAKRSLNTLPFGTQDDVYAVGYEWLNHSLTPSEELHEEPRVKIGGPDCKQPYMASVFNVSAMSYGSLSKNAVLSLNKGAKMGGFYHNTGEGGVSPYHLEPGGDICWQLGTGYFGCRANDGGFDPEKFKKRATVDSIKMIEIKLSQGAKPGHGGILPAAKITPEIAEIRSVGMDEDVISPPSHKAFSSPMEMMRFIQQLREISDGKPIGFKLCVGKRHEFFAICKAMLETNIYPDFITVDGGEGGTGAAPLEFSNSVGKPLNEGLVFVHNALVGCNIRDRIRIIASGKVTTGFHIAAKLAMGADLCNSARGMMFALGCIQALQCHANTCPTGVATQDPNLVAGLDVNDKSIRVANYHKETITHFLELVAVAGLNHPEELRPWNIQRRISSTEVSTYFDIYNYLCPGDLINDNIPPALKRAWDISTPHQFSHKDAMLAAASI